MSNRAISFYPIVVTQDRYGGTYSGGAWLAIACADVPVEGEGALRGTWVLEDGPGGDDITCSLFWTKPPAWIMRGNTPDQAVERLLSDGSVDDAEWTSTFLNDEHPATLKWRAFENGQGESA